MTGNLEQEGVGALEKGLIVQGKPVFRLQKVVINDEVL